MFVKCEENIYIYLEIDEMLFNDQLKSHFKTMMTQNQLINIKTVFLNSDADDQEIHVAYANFKRLHILKKNFGKNALMLPSITCDTQKRHFQKWTV